MVNGSRGYVITIYINQSIEMLICHYLGMRGVRQEEIVGREREIGMSVIGSIVEQ